MFPKYHVPTSSVTEERRLGCMKAFLNESQATLRLKLKQTTDTPTSKNHLEVLSVIQYSNMCVGVFSLALDEWTCLLSNYSRDHDQVKWATHTHTHKYNCPLDLHDFVALSAHRKHLWNWNITLSSNIYIFGKGEVVFGGASLFCFVLHNFITQEAVLSSTLGKFHDQSRDPVFCDTESKKLKTLNLIQSL